MEDQKLSRCGGDTQIDDLPSCLIIDILTRLPTKALMKSRLVCRSWFLLFSDPQFVRLHRARSPTVTLCHRKETSMILKCYNAVDEKPGESFAFKVNVSLPDSIFTCANSCHGLLCLENRNSVYVCNPILGEYIAIPIPNREFVGRVKSVLGFSSKSSQFKVLQIHSVVQIRDVAYKAEIYTIGNGTGKWKSIGIAPSCTFDFPDESVNTFLNGSIHWIDKGTSQVVYFDFESEQFGMLPSPPAWRGGRWSEFTQVRVGVSDGCLCIYGFLNLGLREEWVMNEYGVEESWTKTSSTKSFSDIVQLFYLLDRAKDLFDLRIHGDRRVTSTTYSPSFISLQDVAKSERVTLLSRTM